MKRIYFAWAILLLVLAPQIATADVFYNFVQTGALTPDEDAPEKNEGIGTVSGYIEIPDYYFIHPELFSLDKLVEFEFNVDVISYRWSCNCDADPASLSLGIGGDTAPVSLYASTYRGVIDYLETGDGWLRGSDGISGCFDTNCSFSGYWKLDRSSVPTPEPQTASMILAVLAAWMLASLRLENISRRQRRH